MDGEIAAKEWDLIREAQRGDLRAFSSLVEAYDERAIRIAAGFVGWEDARDLAQEAFVKAYENLKAFKSESRFYTWFYRILVNQCRDFLRKRRLQKFFGLPLKTAQNESDLVETLRDPSKSAEDLLLENELFAQIYEAIQRLPFKQRIAFTLRYIEELKFEEIAETMGLSVGTVKAHCWQAGQKMKRYLLEYQGE